MPNVRKIENDRGAGINWIVIIRNVNLGLRGLSEVMNELLITTNQYTISSKGVD